MAGFNLPDDDEPPERRDTGGGGGSSGGGMFGASLSTAGGRRSAPAPSPTQAPASRPPPPASNPIRDMIKDSKNSDDDDDFLASLKPPPKPAPLAQQQQQQYGASPGSGGGGGGGFGSQMSGSGGGMGGGGMRSSRSDVLSSMLQDDDFSNKPMPNFDLDGEDGGNSVRAGSAAPPRSGRRAAGGSESLGRSTDTTPDHLRPTPQPAAVARFQAPPQSPEAPRQQQQQQGDPMGTPQRVHKLGLLSPSCPGGLEVWVSAGNEPAGLHQHLPSDACSPTKHHKPPHTLTPCFTRPRRKDGVQPEPGAPRLCADAGDRSPPQRGMGMGQQRQSGEALGMMSQQHPHHHHQQQQQEQQRRSAEGFGQFQPAPAAAAAAGRRAVDAHSSNPSTRDPSPAHARVEPSMPQHSSLEFSDGDLPGMGPPPSAAASRVAARPAATPGSRPAPQQQQQQQQSRPVEQPRQSRDEKWQLDADDGLPDDSGKASPARQQQQQQRGPAAPAPHAQGMDSAGARSRLQNTSTQDGAARGATRWVDWRGIRRRTRGSKDAQATGSTGGIRTHGTSAHGTKGENWGIADVGDAPRTKEDDERERISAQMAAGLARRELALSQPQGGPPGGRPGSGFGSGTGPPSPLGSMMGGGGRGPGAKPGNKSAAMLAHEKSLRDMGMGSDSDDDDNTATVRPVSSFPQRAAAASSQGMGIDTSGSRSGSTDRPGRRQGMGISPDRSDSPRPGSHNRDSNLLAVPAHLNAPPSHHNASPQSPLYASGQDNFSRSQQMQQQNQNQQQQQQQQHQGQQKQNQYQQPQQQQQQNPQQQAAAAALLLQQQQLQQQQLQWQQMERQQAERQQQMELSSSSSSSSSSSR
ncbi:MAG: hypothetical protein WDW38_004935 [Sanguina aurantia]